MHGNISQGQCIDARVPLRALRLHVRRRLTAVARCPHTHLHAHALTTDTFRTRASAPHQPRSPRSRSIHRSSPCPWTPWRIPPSQAVIRTWQSLNRGSVVGRSCHLSRSNHCYLVSTSRWTRKSRGTLAKPTLQNSRHWPRRRAPQRWRSQLRKSCGGRRLAESVDGMAQRHSGHYSWPQQHCAY